MYKTKKGKPTKYFLFLRLRFNSKEYFQMYSQPFWKLTFNRSKKSLFNYRTLKLRKYTRGYKTDRY